MRKRPIVVVLIIVAVVVCAWVLRTSDTDPGEMRAKYANANSRFAQDMGLNVHYRDEGNPAGMPLVLLHGNSASLHAYELLRQELGGQYRIITYDHPGHGLTGPHPDDDYSWQGYADALDLVRRNLGLDRFVLAGHSMGGWIAWRYAVVNPDRVEALILIAASGMPLREDDVKPNPGLGFRIMGTSLGRLIAQHYTPRTLVEKSVEQAVFDPGFVTDEMVNRYWELLRYPGNRRASALRSTADREPAYADRVGEVSIPTLLIWGEQDTFVLATAAKTFAERMPDTQTVLYPATGHLPMEEMPEQTARDIARFLEQLDISVSVTRGAGN